MRWGACLRGADCRARGDSAGHPRPPLPHPPARRPCQTVRGNLLEPQDSIIRFPFVDSWLVHAEAMAMLPPPAQRWLPWLTLHKPWGHCVVRLTRTVRCDRLPVYRCISRALAHSVTARPPLRRSPSGVRAAVRGMGPPSAPHAQEGWSVTAGVISLSVQPSPPELVTTVSIPSRCHTATGRFAEAGNCSPGSVRGRPERAPCP